MHKMSIKTYQKYGESSALGYPPETDGKILLLKILYTHRRPQRAKF